MTKRTAIQRLTLMAATAGLFVGLGTQAHAQLYGVGVQFVNGIGTVNQTITVAPGNHILQAGIPPCDDQRDTRFANTIGAVSTVVLGNWGWNPFLAQQGGALTVQFVTRFQQEAAGSGGTIAQFFSDMGASPRYAKCGTVVLIAPQGSHFTNAIAIAYNQGVDPNSIAPNALCDDGSDPPYAKCRQPYAAWRIVVYNKYIVAMFINWSDYTRQAGLTGILAPGD